MPAIDEINLAFYHSDEPIPAWDEIELRAKEIVIDIDSGDSIWETAQPFIDWDELIKSSNQEMNFRNQIYELLIDDLNLFREWLKSPELAGSALSIYGGKVNLFEKNKNKIIARGEIGFVPDILKQPLWVVHRLIDTNILWEAGWMVDHSLSASTT